RVLHCAVEIREWKWRGPRGRWRAAGASLGPSGAGGLTACRRLSRPQLKANIEQFFTRFVEEGKATVRLKEPAVDVRLSKVRRCREPVSELLAAASLFSARLAAGPAGDLAGTRYASAEGAPDVPFF
uniref:PIF1/LRR1 pleckstrin homology domain-containing protein n=1 Tax=Crocodylus porosus TaxID=8502 RepID=A0A7M4FPV5_CROPO